MREGGFYFAADYGKTSPGSGGVFPARERGETPEETPIPRREPVLSRDTRPEKGLKRHKMEAKGKRGKDGEERG